MFIFPANLIPVPEDAPPVAKTFALIMQTLRQAISLAPAMRPGANAAHAARLSLLWLRAGRLVVWLTRLAIRAAEGRAAPRPRPTRRPAAAEPEAAPPPPPRTPKPRLPDGPGWLLRLVPGGAASAGSQLAHLLNQPGMAELLAAAPHAARRLRPLCRMLAVPWQNVTSIDLRPRERVRKPRPRPPAEATDPDAPPKPRRRRATRRLLPATPEAPAAAPPAGPPPRMPAALAARLPEALRPRPPPGPGAAPDPGAYPRLGWARLISFRGDL